MWDKPAIAALGRPPYRVVLQRQHRGHIVVLFEGMGLTVALKILLYYFWITVI